MHLHVPRVNSTAMPAWSTFQQQNVNISRDFRPQLDELDITVITHDFDSYGFDNQAHEVHKSDFLRWKLLAEQGGLWSDIDILYLRPVTNLAENQESNSDLDTVLCPLSPPRKHTVGFMLGSPNNAFYQHMHELSTSSYDPNQYQCMGSELINARYPSLESFHAQFPQHQFVFAHRACVYAIDSKNIEQFYRPVDRMTQKKLNSSRVLGFHWFAGHPMSQEFENMFTPSTIERYDHLLCSAIRHPL